MELEIKSVEKSYGSKRALLGISAVLNPGIYGLLGPNGAGKSTLMNILTDSLPADSGEVCFNGCSIQKLGKDYRNVIGYMPQQEGLLEGFTGRQFLWYMSALKAIPKKLAFQRIRELAAVVNLTNVLDNKVKSYSGGMKQRLLIAQAMLNDPEILILDEPTAGLDPRERIRVRNYISEMAKDKIVLLATHVVSDIEFIAKEVMMLKAGSLIRRNTVPHLLQEIEGKVFEVKAREQDVSALERMGKVSGLAQEADCICVRLVADEKPEGYSYTLKAPRLEDLYIYLYDE